MVALALPLSCPKDGGHLREGLDEVGKLKDLAVEVGHQMGQFEAILEDNKWLKGLLSLARGDASLDARQVREVSTPLLRGLSIYLNANSIPEAHSYLAKTPIDNALAEMERRKLD